MSEATLEDAPTWIVASVCSVIVLISFVFERALHHLGKVRNETNPTALLEKLHMYIHAAPPAMEADESDPRTCRERRHCSAGERPCTRRC